MDFTSYLNDIARAIQAKKKDDTPIRADKFAEEIESLPSERAGIKPKTCGTAELGGVLKKGSKITVDFSTFAAPDDFDQNYDHKLAYYGLDLNNNRDGLRTALVRCTMFSQGTYETLYTNKTLELKLLTKYDENNRTLEVGLGVGAYDYDWKYWGQTEADEEYRYLDRYEKLADAVVVATDLSESDVYHRSNDDKYYATRKLLDRLPSVQFTVNVDLPQNIVIETFNGDGNGWSGRYVVSKIEY